MKVKELIQMLSAFDPESRVLLYSHGTCDVEEEDEIDFVSDANIYDENGNVIETVVELHDY